MPHAPVVTVQYLGTTWNGKLVNAINSRNFVRIVIKGSLASQLKNKLKFPAACIVPAPPFSGVPIPFPNISNCLSGIPTLLSPLVIAYTTKGYTTFKASFDAHGSGPSNDELVLDLR